ncbi:MAG TPA: type I phosphomannose isomerase catalytic subunit [Acidobacteriaceae bacterium]
MQALAPFKLAPYFQTRIWGFRDLAPWFDYKTEGEPIGEVWLTGAKCTVATGPLTGRAFSDVMAEYAPSILGLDQVPAVLPEGASPEFPLLIKVLFAREKLSVQVHPDDVLAQQMGQPRGKTECWYALSAEPGSHVALGLKPGVTSEQVRQAIEDSTLEDLLSWLPIAAGDMVYVDAGTVHAILPGSVILETQQTSDVTFRLYDYGRPRELHVEQSLGAMRLETSAGKIPPRAEDGHVVLVDERYFRVERWHLEGAVEAEKLTTSCNNAAGATAGLLFVSSGAVTLAGEGFDPFTLARCELAVLPASAEPWTVEPVDVAEVMRILPR